MATISFTPQKLGLASPGLVGLAITVVWSIVEVASTVVRGIKKLLSAALRLFRNIIRGIHEGLRVISLAVKCFHDRLFKKPFVTGSNTETYFALTRFDWDGDAFHFVQEGTGGREVRMHHRSIKRLNLAFAIIAHLAVNGIGLITSSFWKNLKSLKKISGTFAMDGQARDVDHDLTGLNCLLPVH